MSRRLLTLGLLLAAAHSPLLLPRPAQALPGLGQLLPKADSKVVEARKQLDAIEADYEQLASGDTRNGQALIDRLNQVQPLLDGASKKDGAWKAQVKRYRDLSEAIVARANAPGASPEPSPAPSASVEAKGASGADRARYDAIVAALQGDDPKRPRPPCRPEDVQAYVAFVLHEREAVPSDVAFLASLKGGRLPGVDDRLLDAHILKREHPMAFLEDSLDKLEGEVSGHLKTYTGRLAFLRGIDPQDEAQRHNLVTKEGAMEAQYAFLEEAARAVDLSRAFYAASGRTGPDHDALLDDVARTREAYDAIVEASMASIRMPRDVGDAELRALGERLLAASDHDAHPVRARSLVKGVTSDSDTRWYEEGGRLVRYDYAWQEFTLATAEETSPGTFFIFYNTFKKFSAGDRTVPKGEWFLGERHQGSRILEKNL